MTRYQHTRDKRGRFKGARPTGLCVYCGALTRKRAGGHAVCASHADLPALDPLYSTPRDQWQAAR